MAESIVQVTEGSGKKLHTFNRTIGANSVEDEVVLQGENYLASYTISAAMSTATANSHLLNIMAGASLKVRIRRILITQRVAATTAAVCPIDIYRTTTAGTGGTAITPAALDTTDPVAGATCQQLPAAKGTESTQLFESSIYFWQTAAASMTAQGPMMDIDFDRMRSKPIIIGAGTTNGIAIKNIAAIAGATVSITVWIDESNF